MGNNKKGRHNALAIANAFIDLAQKDGKELTIRRLCKYVYFAHAWNLSFNKIPLIKESIKTCRNGPIISEVYDTFFKIESNKKAKDNNGNYYHCDLNDKEKEIIKSVYKYYAIFSIVELSDITHTKNSPWFKNIGYCFGWKQYTIPNEDIKKCYDKKINDKSISDNIKDITIKENHSLIKTIIKEYNINTILIIVLLVLIIN